MRRRVVHRDTILWMPTQQILALLIAERDKLERAIEALQGPAKRPSRPPQNREAAEPSIPVAAPSRKKRTFTAAQRKQQAERMKAFWAAKRKTVAKSQPKSVRKPKKKATAA